MQGSTFVGSQLMANYETPDSYNGTGPGSDCWKHSNKIVVPVGAWSCAEWQFDGPTNTMRFWLDGAAVDTLTVMTTGSGCVNQSATYQWTAPDFYRPALSAGSRTRPTARGRCGSTTSPSRARASAARFFAALGVAHEVAQVSAAASALVVVACWHSTHSST